MISEYQNLMHDASTSVFNFRSKCWNAFENQQYGITLFVNKEYKDCVSQIMKNQVKRE